jgi:hypothetical protein
MYNTGFLGFELPYFKNVYYIIVVTFRIANSKVKPRIARSKTTEESEMWVRNIAQILDYFVKIILCTF